MLDASGAEKAGARLYQPVGTSSTIRSLASCQSGAGEGGGAGPARVPVDDRTAPHRTQRNADPHHDERYWPAAVEVVTALAGRPVTGTRP